MYSYKCDLNREVQIFWAFIQSLCPRLLTTTKFNSLVVVMDQSITKLDDAATGEEIGEISAEVQQIVKGIVRNSRENTDKSNEIISNLIEDQVVVKCKVEELYQEQKN